ncbi:Repressor of RNA polymerase III transcription [Symbiodinium microadriaticum]|uniref:Repressor of RNA polymerase III transcription n=1 Tax=Symbiodinium microadriaticum TaxID=2951 RepID=A0A1Q9F5K8_SYMMI|nr:Repressor of RNA polymerase III transcription [Symbiodinium microadriaticum]
MFPAPSENGALAVYSEEGGHHRSRTGSGGGGREGGFLELPHLTQLGAMLKVLDAGDRIIKGRIELFACARRKLTAAQQHELELRCPESLGNSPIGPLVNDASQFLLANLRSLMSLLYVDYDCTHLYPNDFERCMDKHTVVTAINHSLVQVVDRVHTGFLAEFWQAVQEAIDIIGCEVFAFSPASGIFEPTGHALMSFHYFFCDMHRSRILFIGSVTKSRRSARGGGGPDSDSDNVQLSQDSASEGTSKGPSDMSSLQEGEVFMFSDDDEDVII